MFDFVIIWVKCMCDCVSVGGFQQRQWDIWNERIGASPPHNGNSFQCLVISMPPASALQCFSVSAASPAFSKSRLTSPGG